MSFDPKEESCLRKAITFRMAHVYKQMHDRRFLPHIINQYTKEHDELTKLLAKIEGFTSE